MDTSATRRNSSTQARKPSLVDVRRLVGAALCDPRTAVKALTYGPASVRGMPGELCAKAMAELNLKPLCSCDESSPEPMVKPAA